MPALFVGHGTPMNAIEYNEFSMKWEELSKFIPTPRLILSISAHWQTKGSQVTGMQHPKTIHDFYGFPPELFAVEYPADGDLRFTKEISEDRRDVINDQEWGLDHGTWSILTHIYPEADIPVVQLSIDMNKSLKQHFEFAQSLQKLREQGVLIIGSGNIVHNLKLMQIKSNNFNDECGYDWAFEVNNIVREKVLANQIDTLLDYQKLHTHISLAIPTLEHYIPLLYIMGVSLDSDKISVFNDKVIASSLSMTSFIFDTVNE